MEASFENILLIFIIVVAAMYVVLILFFSFSWLNIRQWVKKPILNKTKTSIVVPVRNESENINNCLKSLASQDYPANLFEIIICDDSSTDNTADLVMDFIKKHPEHQIKLLELSLKNSLFKKQAIAEGVAAANGELIITTDGDCVMNERWISSIVSFYEEKKHVMIAGPVLFHEEKNLFIKLQSFEFMSLVASGLGSVSGNFPVMCNGANLAYTKEAFLEVNGYAGNTRYPSGDDIFLLQKIKAKFPGKIGVIKSTDTIVYTHAQKDFKHFLLQRLRWVSKSRGYRSFPAIFTSIVVYLMNFLILVSGIFSFYNNEIFVSFIILIIAKLIVDLPILISMSCFAKRRDLLLFYFPLQILYVMYVSLIGIAGNFMSYRWKGRKVS